jgi:hypothetical protein
VTKKKGKTDERKQKMKCKKEKAKKTEQII